MFDIVDLKTSIYKSRFEAELNLENQLPNGLQPFDEIKHGLEKIREELFGMS